ncbi:MAG TPA: DUF4115 domain-containing protein [Rhodanobacteraceae bacterium]|nr:DUF4115 domain-containing protein [Rhodanobacteraceae bacterium]
MDKHDITARRTGRRLTSATVAGLALILVGVVPALASSPDSIAVPTSQLAHADSTKLQQMTVPELLGAARDAYSHGRLVARPFDNAIEYYLAALRKDPTNRVAIDALRESFPYAAAQVERTIAEGNFDEADREIGLLAEADPGNYTLTILRGKLEAQQKRPGGEHVLTLHASDESWVEVTNANGRVIDSRLLHPGESRSYRSSRPLRITLGNADGVKVTSDGKAVVVKTDPHAKVAHLELFASL